MKLFSILLHTNFRARARKTFRRYRELKPQAIAVLEALREGPGSGHARVRYLRDPLAQGNVWRARVGRHRMIYRIYGQRGDIVPLFLSDRPRNEVTVPGLGSHRRQGHGRLRRRLSRRIHHLAWRVLAPQHPRRAAPGQHGDGHIEVDLHLQRDYRAVARARQLMRKRSRNSKFGVTPSPGRSGTVNQPSSSRVNVSWNILARFISTVSR